MWVNVFVNCVSNFTRRHVRGLYSNSIKGDSILLHVLLFECNAFGLQYLFGQNSEVLACGVRCLVNNTFVRCDHHTLDFPRKVAHILIKLFFLLFFFFSKHRQLLSKNAEGCHWVSQ